MVGQAFLNAGHDVLTCDLLPSENAVVPHYCGDVFDLLIPDAWDLMVAHPPCTHLATSGARWFKDKVVEQAAAIDFVRQLMAAPILRIAIENPVSIISSKIRPPDQTLQPWHYGHGETKGICLWLKNLPTLIPTNIVSDREPRVSRMAEVKNRAKERSRFYPGIAAAMADQWGNNLDTKV